MVHTGSPARRSIHPMTVLNYVLLALTGFIMLYPFWYVLMYSLSTYREVVNNPFLVIPVGLTFENYSYVFHDSSMYTGVINSIFVTGVGTILSLVITLLMAYPMCKRIPGIKAVSFLTYFTLLFGGGMIPTYIVVKNTGLINSLWSLIVPQLINPFYLFIMRNAIREVPESLAESAQLDGASHYRILLQIIVPLCLPMLASIALFYAARYWNAYFDALIYISKPERWTIQLVIRNIIFSQNPELSGGAMVQSEATTTARTLETIKMALLVVSVVPIAAVYPFLQKYFTKGIMVGAIKS